jgi:hypothetical protein
LAERFEERNVQGAASVDEDSIEIDILDDVADNNRIPPRLWHDVRVLTVVEGNGFLWAFKVLMGGGWDRHDLPGCEFLLPPWLIWLGATIDVVDLFMSFREVAHGILGLFLLIGTFVLLENVIYEILESVTVSGLVLSPGVKDADAIQEAFKFTQPGLVLLIVPWLFHCIDRMVGFPLLIVVLGQARLVRVTWLLLLFSGVEGCLLGQGILVSDGEHPFWCLGILHGELMD